MTFPRIPVSRAWLRWPPWAWGALPVVLATLAMGQGLSTSKIFYLRDLTAWHWPEHLWLRRTLLEGRSPLWDPYVAFGQSAISEPVRHLLHPTVLLQLLLPEALGFNLLVALPIPIAALGAYLFFRRHGSAAGASLGAVAFALSGPVISAGNSMNWLWTLAFVPWSIWAVDRIALRRTAGAVSALAVIFALQFLGAEATTLFGSAVLATVYAAFGPAPVESGWRPRVRLTVSTIAGGLAAVLLAAAQVLPAAEAARQSWRVMGLPQEIANLYPLHPLMFLEAVMPRIYGDYYRLGSSASPWLPIVTTYIQSVYVGITTLALAVLGVAARARDRWVRFWIAALVASLVFALGALTPVYPALQALAPPLTTLRAPTKYVIFATIALAALVVSGWDALSEAAGVSGRRTSQKVAVGFAACAAVGSVLAVAVPGSLVSAATGLARVFHAPDPAGTTLANALFFAVPRVAVLAFGTAMLLSVGGSRHRWARLARGVVFALVAADLVTTNSPLNPVMDVALVGAPPWTAAVREHLDERVYVGGHAGMMFLHLPDADAPRLAHGSTMVELAPTAALAYEQVSLATFPSAWTVREAVSYDATAAFPSWYIQTLRRFLKGTREERALFLRRVGVRYYVSTQPPPGESRALAMLYDMEPETLYAGPPPSPRASVVPCAVIESDVMRQIDQLFDPGFDFASEVVVDRDPPPAGRSASGAAPSARIVEDLPTRVAVEASAPDGGGYLLLTDSYNSGWHAEVDGQPAEIVRADGLFRAVRLAPGSHAVIFSYRPASFTIGILVSLVTALLLAACSLPRARRLLYSKRMVIRSAVIALAVVLFTRMMGTHTKRGLADEGGQTISTCFGGDDGDRLRQAQVKSCSLV